MSDSDQKIDPANNSGVEILETPRGEDIDDVEIESYNDDLVSQGEKTPEERLRELREKLKECGREKQENLNGWQRAKADFINYKKREEEGKAEFLKFAREELIIDLLPVLESFSMAFSNKEAWEKVDQSWRSGVEYISTQFVQTLESHGLEKMDPLDEVFDPKQHMGVGEVLTHDKEKIHRIAEVVQPGYRLSGKVVRPPRVKVFSEHEGGATSGS